MTDTPIAHRADGSPIYDNTPTVVSVVIRKDQGILAIKRAQDPGKGRLGLPGGYHMRNETWQQAGAREVLEETGYEINPSHLKLVSLDTDEYGNNLLICRLLPVSPLIKTANPLDGEALEVVSVTDFSKWDAWAFPRHREAAYWEWMRIHGATVY